MRSCPAESGSKEEIIEWIIEWGKVRRIIRMIRLLSVDTKKNERWVGQDDSKTTDLFSSSTSLGAIAAAGRPGHPLTRTRRATRTARMAQ